MTRTTRARAPRRPLLQPRPRLVLLFTLATATVASAVTVSGAPDCASAEPTPSAVRIWQGKGAVTEGEVVVAAAPDEVYGALTSYGLWTTIFPYLAKVDVKSGGRDDAVVQTTNRKGTRHTIRFHNDPAHLVVRFEERGDRAEVDAELALVPGDAAGTTRLRAHLHADVSGVASWFVSDARVRQKREKKLSKDLENIRVYFAAAP
jgi:hypothetical protein